MKSASETLFCNMQCAKSFTCRGLRILVTSFCARPASGELRNVESLLMRRNWLAVLLFALALAFQALAPATANIVGGKGGASGKSAIAGAFVQVCLADAGVVGDQKQTPGKADHHRDFCPLCQSACDGVAPLAARQTVIGIAPVQTKTLSWTVADRALPTPDPDFSRQARAPPAHS